MTLLNTTLAASIAVALWMGIAGCGSWHDDHHDGWDHHDDHYADDHQDNHPDIHQDDHPQNVPGYH